MGGARPRPSRSGGSFCLAEGTSLDGDAFCLARGATLARGDRFCHAVLAPCGDAAFPTMSPFTVLQGGPVGISYKRLAPCKDASLV